MSADATDRCWSPYQSRLKLVRQNACTNAAACSQGTELLGRKITINDAPRSSAQHRDGSLLACTRVRIADATTPPRAHAVETVPIASPEESAEFATRGSAAANTLAPSPFATHEAKRTMPSSGCRTN